MRSLSFIFVACWVSACGSDSSDWLPVEVPANGKVTSVHGVAANEVYAVGKDGLFMRYNGFEWKKIPSNTSASFDAVHASASNDVWALSEEEVYRGTSSGLSKFIAKPTDKLPSSGYFQIASTSAQAVYFCKKSTYYTGELFIYDGSDFFKTAMECQSISASARAGVWILAKNELYRLEGSNFRKVDVGFTATWSFVTARAPDDVWLVSSGGVFLHYDGVKWNQFQTDFKELVVGFASASNDAWFGGDYGSIVHWDGKDFKLVAKSSGSYSLKVTNIWGVSPTDLWLSATDGYSNSHLLRRYVKQENTGGKSQ